jgi:hypothetical protein
MAVLSVLVIRLAASVGALTPATAAAAATALAFIKSRRLSFMTYPRIAYHINDSHCDEPRWLSSMALYSFARAFRSSNADNRPGIPLLVAVSERLALRP